MKLLNKNCLGTPRLINILCQKALMASYGKGEHKVSTQAMQKAIQDTLSETKKPSSMTKPLNWLIGTGISTLLLAACYLHYIGKL
jgi:MSHA biogenesis protein MshM